MITILKTWLKVDFPVVIYIVKVTISALLAMCIAIMFNLPSPQTAMLTVFIVAQPQSGLVFLKSYYRFLGTVVGVIVALVLMSFFAQDRFWFIFFLTIWIAFCTAGGFRYRNFASYGFVLSGYTVLLITLPTLDNPQNTFWFAIDRLSEISLGLITTSVVIELIFPVKISNSLRINERERFKTLFQTLADANNIFNTDKLDKNHASITQGILAPNAIRINSSFESGVSRYEILYYERLNSEFMHLSTSFHSLRTVFYSFSKNNPSYLNETIKNIYDPVEKTLQKYSSTLIVHKDIPNIILDLQKTKPLVKIEIEKQKEQFSIIDEELAKNYQSLLFLIQRMLTELMTYLKTYEASCQGVGYQDDSLTLKEGATQSYKFKTHTDNMLTLLAVIRGASVFLVTMFFWILSGWNAAQFSVLFAVAATIIFSSIPAPINILKGFFIGMIFSVIITYVYAFYLIPLYGTNIVTLGLLLTPPLIFGAWSTCKPQRVPVGLGFIAVMFMLFHVNLQYSMEITSFLDLSFAAFIGLFAAGAGYTIFDGYSATWMQIRISTLFKIQLCELCNQKSTVKRVAFESGSLDLVQQLSNHGRLDLDANKKVFGWLLFAIEIGRAIINVKTKLSVKDEVSYSSSSKLGYKILTIVKKYIQTDSKQKKKALLQEYDSLLTSLSCLAPKNRQEEKNMKDIVSEFTLIYMILLNYLKEGVQ